MRESRGNRLHIVALGKVNTGKSSIINAIFQREISIVSNQAGTTTDVNQKAMELLPLGPVSILDTAGLDDNTELGSIRIKKTLETLNRADVAIMVFDNNPTKDCDIELFRELKERKIPILSIINKSDLGEIDKKSYEIIEKYSDNIIKLSATNDKEITAKVKQGLINVVSEEYISSPLILADIVEQGDTVVQVIPIDKEAPKGRIILPQVQVLRDMLDNKITSVVCDVETLKHSIDNLKNPPKLVITDSQAFYEVDKIVDKNIMLTSYSIVFARLKGDLKSFVQGANTLDELEDNDEILICESCSHHAIEDDIGRVKLPNLIKKYSGKNINFSFATGHIFPSDIEKYKLIIHCGACMTNRREVLSRIQIAHSKGVEITNYGVAIAKCLNILDRTLEPFKI